MLNPTDSDVHAVPNCAGRPLSKNWLGSALDIMDTIPRAMMMIELDYQAIDGPLCALITYMLKQGILWLELGRSIRWSL